MSAVIVESVKLGLGTTLSPVLVTLLVASGLLYAYYYYQMNNRMRKVSDKIPGPPTIPFLGNAHLAIGKNPSEVMAEALRQSDIFPGKVVRAWFGQTLVVALWDPQDVEVILSSHTHIDKSNEYRFFKPWLGNGLLISTGDKWRAHRKLIAPAFHQNVLKSFINVFNNNSRAVVERLQKEVGKEFDIHDHLSQTTVDILLETAMGISRKTHDSSGFDYAMAVMKMCEILHLRHYHIWFRYDLVFNWTNLRKQQEKLLGIIHGLTSKVLKYKKEEFIKNNIEGKYSPDYFKKITAETERENELEEKSNYQKKVTGLRDDLDDIDENDVGEKRRLAFLDLMIESAQNGAAISDREIKEQVDTIMFEGHDTTAAGSSFVMCLLGVHKHIQDRVYQEIHDIFGDSDRPATFADTLEMKYLERVILESLRMYPPVPLIARTIKNDLPLGKKGYVIPAGATIVIPMFKIHRDPDTYPNPEVFDPDNFLPENTSKRHYYSFIPFSAGPRSCVGRKYAMLKLKILLSTIIRNYRIKSDLTEKDFVLQADIILKRTDGFRIQLEPRTVAAH